MLSGSSNNLFELTNNMTTTSSASGDTITMQQLHDVLSSFKIDSSGDNTTLIPSILTHQDDIETGKKLSPPSSASSTTSSGKHHSTSSNSTSTASSTRSSPAPASSHQQQQQQQINQQHDFVCALCKNSSNNSTEAFKLMQCLHMMCRDCATHSIHTEFCDGASDSFHDIIQCPTCGTATKVKDGNVDSLIDFYAPSRNNATLLCTSCTDATRAVARCLDCVKLLCYSCAENHIKMVGLFKNHQLVPLPPSQQQHQQMNNNCKLHGNSLLTFYCLSCQESICLDCATQLHKSHQIKNLDDLLANLRQKVCDECQTTIQKLAEYQHLPPKSGSGEQLMAQQLDKDCERETLRIVQYIDMLKKSAVGVLDKLQLDLLNDLSCQKEHMRSLVANMPLILNRSLTRLDNLSHFTDTLVNNKGGNNRASLGLLAMLIFQQKQQIFSDLLPIEYLLTAATSTSSLIFDEQQQRAVSMLLMGKWFEFVDAKELEKMFAEIVGRYCYANPKDEKKQQFNNISNLNNRESLAPPGLVTRQQQQPMLFQTNVTSLSPPQQHPQSQHLMIDPNLFPKQQLPSSTSSSSFHTSALASHPSFSSSSGDLITAAIQKNAPANLDLAVGGSSAAAAAALAANRLLSMSSASSTSSSISSSCNISPPSVAAAAALLTRSSTNAAAATPVTNDDYFQANIAKLTQILNQPQQQPQQTQPLNVLLTTSATTPNLLIMPPSPSSSSNGATSSAGATAVPSFNGNGNLNPPVRQNGRMVNMLLRNKFGSQGSTETQFNSPHGFCLSPNEELVIADTNNHQIKTFTLNGDYTYSFGLPGKEEGQLWYPRKVVVLKKTGNFVVCDRGNERSRMQIFSSRGKFLRKIAIRYIDIVAGLAVNSQDNIVAVDSVSPTVFIISSESGELVRWFDCSEHMREPSDLAIYMEEYYICDFKGHCVKVFSDTGALLRTIGGENITNFPNGIDISDDGDVLVGDSHGNRFHVAVFARNGQLLREFECPHSKVSRCCGLKITSEGFIVTLAKNNHFVLVLNTLYVE